MFWSRTLVLSILQVVAAVPWTLPSSNVNRSTDLQTAKNIIPLRKTAGTMAPSSQVGDGVTYDAEVHVGDQHFHLILDTGSANLWVPRSTFECFTVDGQGNRLATDQSACAFGPLYNGTFTSIPNENLNISYGFGGFVTGTFGYENVSFGGITIEQQEIAIVDQAHWEGAYSICSGIIGFAYPQLSSGYTGNNPAIDTNTTAIHITPWVFNAIDQNKIDPLFSIALERGKDGGHGHIALGGLPDVEFTHQFASTTLEAIAFPVYDQYTNNFTYYTITPQGYTVNGSMVSTDFPFIVDSGSSFVNLPDDMAKHINQLFDPPAVYNETLKAYEVGCDATPPCFGVTIGGKLFNVNPKDMVVRNAVAQTPSSGKCLTGVQPSGISPAFLGDVFLKNVVAVFDIGSSQLHFAPHEYY